MFPLYAFSSGAQSLLNRGLYKKKVFGETIDRKWNSPYTVEMYEISADLLQRWLMGKIRRAAHRGSISLPPVS